MAEGVRQAASGPSLPSPLTRFFGREAELAELVGLAASERLVTVVGAPGCGKTRLVVEAAAQLGPRFTGGMAFVDLAPVADPDVVAHAVGTALGIPEAPGERMDETIVDALGRADPTIVVVDNCEHLVSAVADLVHRLVVRCSSLHVLGTSRVVLDIPGEHVWHLPPLDPVVAAELFADRAALASGAELDPAERGMVEDICARLDGLPLAVELVAAWTRVLSPVQIADRLASALPLLRASTRGRDPRHETMMTTVDASCRLLPPAARRLFTQLSVFAGGFDMDAAVAVAGPDDPDDVLEALATLVDHSLVVAGGIADGQRRYRLLEPVRQCAAGLAEASGDLEAVRLRHAEHYLALARGFDPWGMNDPATAVTLERLEQEEGNLRAARDWMLVHRVDLLLKLMEVLGPFWEFAGRVNEGRDWCEAVRASAPTDDILRRAALFWSGRLAWRQGFYETARQLVDESLAGLSLREVDPQMYAYMLTIRATTALSTGDAATAIELCDEAVALAENCEHDAMLANALVPLGWACYVDGDVAAGDERLRRALEVTRRHDSASAKAQAHFGLQYGAFLAGDTARQRVHLVGALRAIDAGGMLDKPDWLSCAAALAAREGRFHAALRLVGGAETLRGRGGSRYPGPIATPIIRVLEPLLHSVAPGLVSALMAEGAAMSWDALAADAVAPGDDSGSMLSRREIQIVDLVAQGLTNAEIAQKLSISRRTVDSHLDHIRRKLGLSSRRQIVVWAVGASSGAPPRP